MNRAYRILPAGERALSVEFGDDIDPALNERVLALDELLRRKPISGVRETVVSYRSLLVVFESERLTARRLRWALNRRIAALGDEPRVAAAGAILDIPVCYGGAYGPDLSDVAAHCGMTPEEVVRRHAAPVYRVYMLGFMPGFPYLGGLDPSIEVPRLGTPREVIPAGSVGIGGKQTGVYPFDSPGGWRLIGRTPSKLYKLDGASVLARPGDAVRFIPIGEDEYRRLANGEGMA